MNTMKEKLFKLLFPGKVEEIRRLKIDSSLWEKRFTEVRVRELNEQQKEKPTMADLMRDSVGLPMIDFVNVDSDGEPQHYLHGLDKDQRAVFIGELSNIYRKPEFQAVLNYWVNMFGNYAVRNAKGDSQPGRYGINGIASIRKSLESANKEFMELNSPDEDDEEEGE